MLGAQVYCQPLNQPVGPKPMMASGSRGTPVNLGEEAPGSSSHPPRPQPPSPAHTFLPFLWPWPGVAGKQPCLPRPEASSAAVRGVSARSQQPGEAREVGAWAGSEPRAPRILDGGLGGGVPRASTFLPLSVLGAQALPM